MKQTKVEIGKRTKLWEAMIVRLWWKGKALPLHTTSTTNQCKVHRSCNSESARLYILPPDTQPTSAPNMNTCAQRTEPVDSEDKILGVSHLW